MAKAYDRVKNANNAGDVFIKTPAWTNEVEAAFEAWKLAGDRDSFEDLCAGFLAEDVAISFKSLEGSICCTLAHQPSRETNSPYLLTGWSEHPSESLAVAMYKLEVMLQGIWAQPSLPPAPRRR